MKIEYLSQSECDTNMWSSRPIVIYLDDGNWIIPMKDDEGNDGGAITTPYPDLPTIPVMNRN